MKPASPVFPLIIVFIVLFILFTNTDASEKQFSQQFSVITTNEVLTHKNDETISGTTVQKNVTDPEESTKFTECKKNELNYSDNFKKYSIVHLSDTQNLATLFPETYDYTFSYLDTIRKDYNISAIIITGDLVNSWDNKEEWNVYSHAVNETSIPVYVIAGNHDTNSGLNFTYYTEYTGNTKKFYVTPVNDFDLVGINYVKDSLGSHDIADIRQDLTNSSHTFTIVATHYYMDTDGTLSPLGKEIEKQLIVRPTIVMTGHKHVSVIMKKNIGTYSVIEDLSNYQDGPYGKKIKRIILQESCIP